MITEEELRELFSDAIRSAANISDLADRQKTKELGRKGVKEIIEMEKAIKNIVGSLGGIDFEEKLDMFIDYFATDMKYPLAQLSRNFSYRYLDMGLPTLDNRAEIIFAAYVLSETKKLETYAKSVLFPKNRWVK